LKNGYGGGILDIGLQASSVGSRVYAALKGIVDSGFDIPCSSEVFPSEERIRGKHIAEYREQSSDLPEQFEATKEKIFAEFS
jgi:large subunit ribosomal protein L18